MKQESETTPEILSLNLDDLDVQELEHRLELASLWVDVARCNDNSGGCGINKSCGSNTGGCTVNGGCTINRIRGGGDQ